MIDTIAPEAPTSAKAKKHKSTKCTDKQIVINSEAGYRLQRLEVLNWGTFDQKIWLLNKAGYGSLLTGDNGSGKSTLVDALLTLLVPNKKRNYNLSSGAERRERSEQSYVKGAYSKEQNDFNQGQVKYLRQEDHYSVLLASFQDSTQANTVVLCQVFWFDNNQLKKIYVISHTDLSIAKHFNQFANVRELRTRLKNIASTELFSSFNDYESYFRQIVGLRSAKALDLFNQITAIKEIGQLNGFVRTHMLDATDVKELLDQLYENYNNLSLAHQAIVTARQQLTELEPLVELMQTHRENSEQILEFETQQTYLPYYFERKKQVLLNESRATLQSDLATLEGKLSAINENCHSLQAQHTELSMSMNQDKTTQAVERFELLMNRQKEKKQEKFQYHQQYIALSNKLELSEPTDSEIFSQNLETLKTIENTTENALTDLRDQEYQFKKDQEQNQQKLDKLSMEIESLKNRKNQIPECYAALRQSLADHLNIKTATLPFIAELIQVKPNEQAWKDSIERALREIALNLLVPKEHCHKVNRYLIKNHLGLQLRYHAIDLESEHSLVNAVMEDNILYNKLEFKPRAKPYVNWIKNLLYKNYSYVCIADTKDLRINSQALTQVGLIKRNNSLHEKNDHCQPDDFDQHLLGWDNSAKQAFLIKEYKTYEKNLRSVEKKFKESLQQLKKNEALRDTCQQLKTMKPFSKLDWSTHAKEIEKLSEQCKVLLSKNTNTQKLNSSLKSLKAKLTKSHERRDKLLADIAVLQNQLSVNQAQLQSTTELLENLPVNKEKIENIERNIEKLLKKSKLSIKKANIDDIHHTYNTLGNELNARLKTFNQRKNGLITAMVKRMSNFKALFPESSTQLDASIDALDGFMQLKEKLDRESLPEHEQRFKKLLNKSVLNDMLAFRSTLDLAYENIEESIQQLNDSLKEIQYTDKTYVQLKVTKTRDAEVREFHNMINNAMKMTEKGNKNAELEANFSKIKLILDQLKTQERWRKKVIDPRNWADFFVIEHYKDGRGEKNFYSDSSGLSGGQKAKLAFTILASAVAYQYGLNSQNKSKKSFRFVVIDEAFSKSDETNARYAMELFKNLGLQLMVVTPRDKIYVVEPYVKNIFITQINEDQSYSQLYNMHIELS